MEPQQSTILDKRKALFQARRSHLELYATITGRTGRTGSRNNQRQLRLQLHFFTPRYKEEQLEEALATQITRFLLELGTGFAYIGRQIEIVVAGKSRRIDMLFYHIKLRSYIVCELKAVPFEPEFAGKLNFYVTAVNKLMKTEQDNPTIGLLICSDLNKTEVQWSFETITSPIGVASYSNVRIEEMKKLLPSEEQLTQRVKQLEIQLKRHKRKEKQ